jgi:hypothetical protein
LQSASRYPESGHSRNLQHPEIWALRSHSLQSRTFLGQILCADGGSADKTAVRSAFSNDCYCYTRTYGKSEKESNVGFCREIYTVSFFI